MLVHPAIGVSIFQYLHIYLTQNMSPKPCLEDPVSGLIKKNSEEVFWFWPVVWATMTIKSVLVKCKGGCYNFNHFISSSSAVAYKKAPAMRQQIFSNVDSCQLLRAMATSMHVHGIGRTSRHPLIFKLSSGISFISYTCSDTTAAEKMF